MASRLAVDGDRGAEGPAEDDVIVVLTGGRANTVTARGVDAAHFGIAIGAAGPGRTLCFSIRLSSRHQRYFSRCHKFTS